MCGDTYVYWLGVKVLSVFGDKTEGMGKQKRIN